MSLPVLKDEERSKIFYEEYHRARGPFLVRGEGRPSLYVISAEDCADDEDAPTPEELSSLRAGLAALECGDQEDAFEVAAHIRAVYGL